MNQLNALTIKENAERLGLLFRDAEQPLTGETIIMLTAIDKFFIGLAKFVRENNIDNSQSAVFKLLLGS